MFQFTVNNEKRNYTATFKTKLTNFERASTEELKRITRTK
jgi:hypothetical protein